MRTDWHVPGSNSASPQTDEAIALKEVAEALTALGNYVEAAHTVANTKSGLHHLAEILIKAVEQHNRSATAVRRVRALVLSTTSADHRPPATAPPISQAESDSQ